MTLKRSNEHLSRPTRAANSPVLSLDSKIMRSLASSWYDAHLASRVPRTRAIESLPVRASELSVRCDRAYWYTLTDTPETNPDDASNIWRFRLGQIVHDEIDASIVSGPLAYANGTGWKIEVDIDLRPAGIPGSAHGDAIHYTDDVADIVAEFKSVPGFGFKNMTTTFKGPPEGPKWEHCLQAAVVAVAQRAPMFIVGYVSLENISPKVAKSMNLDEFAKFTAEWQFDTADWEPIVAAEAKRQERILRLVQRNQRPARTLSSPDYPATAFVDDPNRGSWLLAGPEGNVVNSGTTWMCGYCRFRDQCIEDGASSIVEPINIDI